MELYIGLMSGTSADGVDAAVVDFSQSAPHVLATHYMPYDKQLREQILALCQPADNEIQRLGELDVVLGKTFAQAVTQLLVKQSLPPEAIKAIGSHGQTIRHAPHLEPRFTLQIGDPNTIAAETGITTVADFRRKDIALGGQGAPLVPAFHQYLFSTSQQHRAIVNIGGIANITVLPKDSANIIGYDTGPGNLLMDAWIALHQQQNFDLQGNWASQGNRQDELLKHFLEDSYFSLSPPKSTGREYFNLGWIENKLTSYRKKILPVDVQASLAELTAAAIVTAVQSHLSEGEMLICGGGVQNIYLMSRIAALAQPAFTVKSTEAYGIHPDWLEAIAFAWLARQTLNKRAGNLPEVTGAKQAAILGSIHY